MDHCNDITILLEFQRVCPHDKLDRSNQDHCLHLHSYTAAMHIQHSSEGAGGTGHQEGVGLVSDCSLGTKK